jgi:hypothetical protein
MGNHLAYVFHKVFDKINITVQDSFEMISKAPQIESSLIPRVSFMVHDFFTPQPITSASAYLLRQVTHNWNDEDCIRIIRAVVPALEKSGKNTPLFINEIVLPELDDSGDQTNKYEERRLRQVDMMMMIAFGAKQRARNEFRMLLRKADHRLEVSHSGTYTVAPISKADTCGIDCENPRKWKPETDRGAFEGEDCSIRVV